VIHLAAAVAVAISEGERTGHPHTSYGDILCNKNLIEEIISRAEYHENLIKNNRIPLTPGKLIPVRLALN
jgi:hypothetical protein